MAENNTLTESQFDDTPAGWQKRWAAEFQAADKMLSKFHEKGDKVVKRYVDDREETLSGGTRLNLFTSNVQTLLAMLYGKTPNVEAKRRYFDPNDDVARVSAEIFERMLNYDIEKATDCFTEALRQALHDRLLPGLGMIRHRYVVQTEEVPGQPAITTKHPVTGEEMELAPAVPPTSKKSYEDVETDYVYWKDVKFSPCRTFEESRWWAFKAEMLKDQFVERFGEKKWKLVPKNAADPSKTNPLHLAADPWQRVEVWEIWDKEHRKRWMYVAGMAEILEDTDDPLGLDGFYPFPRPLASNLSTSLYLPVSDYYLAQDLYNEIDEVSEKIRQLAKAVAVRGVYDGAAGEVARLLTDTGNNELIPTNNFGAWKEKGGLKGAIDWLDITNIVDAMNKLREYRSELINLLFQVTGLSDVLRGAASAAQATATEQAIKAKFASVRMEWFQDELARFASDAQRIRAEIISKMFDPETILTRANVRYMNPADAQLAMQAVDLIKSEFYQYRISIRPEAIALADYAQAKQDRAEFLTAMATYLQSAQPLIAGFPPIAPFLFQMLQWAMSTLKGASTVEGLFDQMVGQINQALANPPPPKPDPKMQAEMVKLQGVKIKAQAESQKAQAAVMQTQLESRIDAGQAMLDVKTAMVQNQMDLSKMAAQARLDGLKTANAIAREKAKAREAKP